MLIGRKPHTVGDKRKYIVDYSQWLDTGITLTAGTATTTSLTASVDTVSHTDTTLIFFVHGGALNEIFTVVIQVTDTNSEVKNDTVEFFVVAP
jgi:hypothetical protein